MPPLPPLYKHKLCTAKLPAGASRGSTGRMEGGLQPAGGNS